MHDDTRAAVQPRGDRLLWLTAHRVFCAGLLGPVRERLLGGWSVYVGAAAGQCLRLRIGHPDATHFGHCIRRVCGLRPGGILAGSRRLALHAAAPAAAARH